MRHSLLFEAKSARLTRFATPDTVVSVTVNRTPNPLRSSSKAGINLLSLDPECLFSLVELEFPSLEPEAEGLFDLHLKHLLGGRFPRITPGLDEFIVLCPGLYIKSILL